METQPKSDFFNFPVPDKYPIKFTDLSKVGPHLIIRSDSRAYRYGKSPELKYFFHQERIAGFTRSAVYKGKIKRPHRCTYCLKVVTPEGHHITYDDPFEDIAWYCRQCHRKWHANKL